MFPHNYGDVHAGLYNGEGYHDAGGEQPEVVPVPRRRPAVRAGRGGARGLRVTGFYDADNYLQNGREAARPLRSHYEHTYLHAAFDYLDTHDQKLPALPSHARQGLVGLAHAALHGRAGRR